MSDTKSILEKLDKLDSRLDGIDITLVKQNASLEHHIFRTDLAEQRIDDNEDRINVLEKLSVKFLAISSFLGVLFTLVLGLKELGIIFK